MKILRETGFLYFNAVSMKTTYPHKVTFFTFFCSLYLFSFTGSAQVGINTTEPRTTLEVAGDVYVDGAIKVEGVNNVLNNQAASFLVETQANFIEELDASEEGSGLVIAYFQEYVLKNMKGDWVEEFHTNIDASKYVITIISAYFNQELKMSSEIENFSIPYASAYVKGDTWWIKADYPGADPSGSLVGEWVINTLILSKNFSKEFPQEIVPMGGSNTQHAINPIIN